jgi:uncharacterized protein (TIGR02145 family)
VSSAIIITDAEGKAEISWTLGTTMHSQILTITALKADGISPIDGSPLSVTALVASSLELISGNNQTGEILNTLEKPIIVQVKDNDGKSLAGIPIVFQETLPLGGDMYIPLFEIYDTTDIEGRAQLTWKLQNEHTLSAQRNLNIMIVDEDSLKAEGTPLITASATATPLANSVTDIEGNIYKILAYADRVWMTSNLRTTKYNDGSDIPNVSDKTSWLEDKNGAYCWYNNDISYKDKSGALYNWYVINTDKLCPAGWHTPTDAEWKKLINYLTEQGYGYGGSGNDIAKAMAAPSGWSVMQQVITHAGEIAHDIASNNSSGFSAYPTGSRILDVDGKLGYYDFFLDYSTTYFWTHDNIGLDIWGMPASKSYSMSSLSSTVAQTTRPHHSGNSVRCVRD